MLKDGENLRFCSYRTSGCCYNPAKRWFIRQHDQRVITRCLRCPYPYLGDPEEVSKEVAQVYVIMRS